MDEATCDKRVRGLRANDAATDATAYYKDEMARGGVAIKSITGEKV